MSTEHNPDNLTPEQVGEGWRLLKQHEPITDGDERWDGQRWKRTNLYGFSPSQEFGIQRTYRRRITPDAGKAEAKAVKCATCGSDFDPFDLNAVLFHETHTPAVAVNYAGSSKVGGEPCALNASAETKQAAPSPTETANFAGSRESNAPADVPSVSQGQQPAEAMPETETPRKLECVQMENAAFRSKVAHLEDRLTAALAEVERVKAEIGVAAGQMDYLKKALLARSTVEEEQNLRAELSRLREEIERPKEDKANSEAIAYESGANDALSGIKEVVTNPDGEQFSEWDEMKPLLRIRYYEDSGDPEAGVQGWASFIAHDDQNGTILADILAQLSTERAAREQAEKECERLKNNWEEAAEGQNENWRVILSLREQIAESESREHQVREALKVAGVALERALQNFGCDPCQLIEAHDSVCAALTAPTSTTVADLRLKLETAERERDAASAILSACLAEMPCGNVATHTPENLPERIADLAKDLARTDAELDAAEAINVEAGHRLAKAQNERDAAAKDRERLEERIRSAVDDDIVSAYIAGASIRDIAKRSKLSKDSIRIMLRIAGTEIRPPGFQPNWRKTRAALATTQETK